MSQTHTIPQTHEPFTITNKIVFTELLASARELGAEAGKGKDTQIKFLLKAVEGAYHGALDLAPNKHGDRVDDATVLAEAYVEAQQGAVVFDAKAMNQRKLISTLRTSVKLGIHQIDGHPGGTLETVTALMHRRQEFKRMPDPTLGTLDDAANTLLKYARAQVRLPTLIPAEELAAFCFRKKREPATVATVLGGLVSRIDHLLEGGLPKTAGPAVTKARNALQRELAKLEEAAG